MRIVSLLPAATEIVWALGLADELVGISHACDHPPAVAGRPVVTSPAGAREGAGSGPARRLADEVAGGARKPPVNLRGDVLAGLRPDLVLAGRMAGVGSADPEGAIRAAVGPHASLVILEPTSLEGIFHAIVTVGAMTEAEDEAVGLVEILRERLADIEEVVQERRDGGHHAPRVVALDWLHPPSSAGLWVPEQIRRSGGWEVLATDGQPSVPASWEAVAEVDPEMLLLVPCGMRLSETVRTWRSAPRPALWSEMAAVRRGQVFALDASAHFSRPGPRVIDGIELLAEIFDPTAFVDIAPPGSWVPVQ